MAEVELWCYVKGHPNCFGVSILPSQTIDVLKTKIYAAKDKSFGLVRFCTIYESAARDLCMAPGPMLIYFSLDPPNDDPANRMRVAPVPVPVPAPAPVAVTIPPRLLPPPMPVPTSSGRGSDYGRYLSAGLCSEGRGRAPSLALFLWFRFCYGPRESRGACCIPQLFPFFVDTGHCPPTGCTGCCTCRSYSPVAIVYPFAAVLVPIDN